MSVALKHLEESLLQVRRLQKIVESLQMERDQLKREQMEWKKTMVQYQSQATHWEQMYHQLKLTAPSSDLDDVSRKALQQQLNEFIKEIDACLAMLNEE